MRAYVCVCLFSKLFSIGKHNKLFELRWEWNNFDSQQHAEKFEKSYLRIRTNRYAFIFSPLQILSLYYTWHKMDGKMTNKINTQKPLVFLSIYNKDNGTEKKNHLSQYLIKCRLYVSCKRENKKCSDRCNTFAPKILVDFINFRE